MSETIHVEYDLPHPPEKVWRALTDAQLVSSWLMVNDLKPIVGHKFTFRAQPMPGWDGLVQCEVLAADAPKLLKYSWRGGNVENRLDTIVTWTLTPTPKGTKLTLDHSGFLPKDANAFNAMGQGWRGRVGERMSAALDALQ